MPNEPELQTHKEWLGLLQPVGLVVSPLALQRNGVFVNRNVFALEQELQDLLIEAREEAGSENYRIDFERFAGRILGWEPYDLVGSVGGRSLPEELAVALPELGEVLTPSYAVADPEVTDKWMLIVQVLAPEVNLDAATDDRAWSASAQARMERLLREKEIPIGLLWNSKTLRLVYYPKGESSGHLDFPVELMAGVAGRSILGALQMLLGVDRLFNVPTDRRLSALLAASRKYQNEVSNRLAEQVLDALWELLRGFQAADAAPGGKLLNELARTEPRHIYGGLITVLMRLVFLLYAEDRGLMPQEPIYEINYSVAGLFARLREDEANYPDTMDQRYGAWAWLVSLFRLAYEGGHHLALSLPARRGELFDPDHYPFLEGREYGNKYESGKRLEMPRVSDGVVYSVLRKLLVLDGERLSYRTLDVEQIGSVYEGIMGYAVEQATGPSIALKPKDVVVDLSQLLAVKPADRAKWLKDSAACDVKGAALTELKSAKSSEDLQDALRKKTSPRTPRPLVHGSLYLQPGEERRRSGSHYTPRALTEPIVRTALRPHFENFGPNPTPEQILDLKVCDPAMGSGAFLVEACRQLAEHLVEAWQWDGVQIQLPPDEDILLYARRIVAQRCLYGVDKNPFAVSLAKLSLWLVTLARDHTFTFLDSNLKTGDSLVGVSRSQIGAFHWLPQSQDLGPLFRHLRENLAQAEAYRNEIQNLSDDADVEKYRLFEKAELSLADARLLGDALVGIFFSAESDRARDLKRREIRPAADAFEYPQNRALLQQLAQRIHTMERPIVPFHWEIEFPEVFDRSESGFGCFIGNPPFAGKNTTINAYAEGYLDWLKTVHPESHGNADIVAHFFRRAFNLLCKSGTLGLIATNTIAQGDTRNSGLRWLCTHEGTIYNAIKRLKWPGLAAVVVSVIHVLKGKYTGKRLLDRKQVDQITAFLFHAGGNDDPTTLEANANKSFQGSIVLGMGFTFDDTNPEATPIAEMHRLIRENPRNKERIFPYIGGEEVNSSPTHAGQRYVINFFDREEEEAWQWPDLMEIIKEKVKPERDIQKRDALRIRWWQYAEKRPGLVRAIQGLERVLVTCLVSKYLTFAFLPSGMVYSHKLAVFPLEKFSSFAMLQTRIHEVFAHFFSSTMKDDINYSPSDCFETFPFPTNWEENEELESIGQEYYEFRAALMVCNNKGLTDTYNRFHDPDEHNPDIHKLRQLHAKMDRAVLDAYGWTDISTDCEFLLDYEDEESEEEHTGQQQKKPWRYRWPDEVRDEVLARLLELNRQRAEEEKLMGAAAEKGRRPTTRRRTTAVPRAAEGQSTLDLGYRAEP